MIEIALECRPDETLIRKLGYSQKFITHQPDKGRVLIFLQRNANAIGIIDEDPGTTNPGYFSHFKKQGQEIYHIDHYHRAANNTRLLVIKPRLEEWIIRYALEVKIKLSDFSLPADGHQLHKIINTRLPKFEAVLSEMLKKESKALRHLKQLIESHRN